jgi:hypothetical protein
MPVRTAHAFGGRNADDPSALIISRCEMASNFICFVMGAVAPLSLVSWLIAFH